MYDVTAEERQALAQKPITTAQYRKFLLTIISLVVMINSLVLSVKANLMVY